ncbi:DUF6233 domain-containing protein [Streptomyces buecherae]|uniref:DUF6233 domain-containing protein n=1 Tax=Streptomyces buecherae TaxID=2763006 RepID=UPI0033FB070E
MALAQIDGWIEAEERREGERRQAEARRPPPPEWLVEQGPNRGGVIALHTGDCWTVSDNGRRFRPATRQHAIEAVQRQVVPCPRSRSCRRSSMVVGGRGAAFWRHGLHSPSRAYGITSSFRMGLTRGAMVEIPPRTPAQLLADLRLCGCKAADNPSLVGHAHLLFLPAPGRYWSRAGHALSGCE